MPIYDSILQTIGRTPIVRVKNLFPSDVSCFLKMERANPGGSIKDRIALAMIEDAERRGLLKPGSVIIEPTSGNTGIGLALVAAVKRLNLVLVMPESMSIERRRLMAAYGAKLELTPRAKGMPGAIARAEEMVRSSGGTAWMPSQFDNRANVAVHEETTAREIVEDFGAQNLPTHYITGVGTGGHLTGVARVLKAKKPGCKVFAVEPQDSPVISGGSPSPHPIQGIGAGFIPKNLDTSLLDGVIQVSKEEAFEMTKRAAKEEGILAGISSGATLAACAKKIPELPKGSRILLFNYDNGSNYFSIEGLF